MLVLSRKVDEQIIIGDNVRVTVVSIRGNQVRLGFEAPSSVPIFREELHMATCDEPHGPAQAQGSLDPENHSAGLLASAEH